MKFGSDSFEYFCIFDSVGRQRCQQFQDAANPIVYLSVCHNSLLFEVYHPHFQDSAGDLSSMSDGRRHYHVAETPPNLVYSFAMDPWSSYQWIAGSALSFLSGQPPTPLPW